MRGEAENRILIVDDDEISTFISKRVIGLTSTTKEIATAINGQQAIDLFQTYYAQLNSVPDVILLDLDMPVMNGFEFLKAFAELELKDKDKIKIIILSSSVTAADISRAMELGAKDFLTKPLTAEHVKRIF